MERGTDKKFSLSMEEDKSMVEFITIMQYRDAGIKKNRVIRKSNAILILNVFVFIFLFLQRISGVGK